MSTFPLDDDAPRTAAASLAADAQMVGRVRLLLALSALLAAVVGQPGQHPGNALMLTLLSCYAAACAIACAGAEFELPFALGRGPHRFDVAAFLAIFAATGNVDIVPFIFLFFAILVASTRWGLGEGMRAMLVALMIYCVGAIAAGLGTLAQIVAAAAVWFILGYGIASLGEGNIRAMRRLNLLRELNTASNPRFGIDRAMTAAMESTRAFFLAERCVVLLEEPETGKYYLRSVRQHGPLAESADMADPQLGHALLLQPATQVLLHRAPRWPRLALTGLSLSRVGETKRWCAQEPGQYRDLADLLDAGSFISAPLVIGRRTGRIYVTTRRRSFGRGDALFLAQIAAYGLRAIDRIDLLDRIASEAASVERNKLALDLHDSAVQPYVGLKLGLAALYQKAQADAANPLIDDLKKLLTVADDAIGQLRHYARDVHRARGAQVPICLAALKRQSEQLLAFYGIDISIHMEERIAFGDRLTAEVLQIVREALSNLRRHTAAKRGAVSLSCDDELLRIEIGNENGGQRPPSFVPRSISARAAALGGSASVRQGTMGSTIVCVEIPI
jgi:signal transduction histidine kinase